MKLHVITEKKKRAKINGFVDNIDDLTVQNTNFRQVLYTSNHNQLVVMSIPPQGDIGEEIHGVDQFFRIEEGNGTVVINGIRTAIGPGFGIIVPAGVTHNLINTGDKPLKVYTIYSPPHHKDGTTHRTSADAKDEHFDGETTE